jgi:hypothetical protein
LLIYYMISWSTKTPEVCDWGRGGQSFAQSYHMRL